MQHVVVKRAGEHDRSTARFRWVKPPTNDELTQLTHTIAQCIARFLERQGLLGRDAENSYLALDAVDEDPMNQLLGHSITYRIAVRRKQGQTTVFVDDCYEYTTEDSQKAKIVCLREISIFIGS